jgi:hypothetical protein
MNELFQKIQRQKQIALRNIGGGRVICQTPIDVRHWFARACKQIVGGELLGLSAGLVICQYPEQAGFYLFGSGTNLW